MERREGERRGRRWREWRTAQRGSVPRPWWRARMVGPAMVASGRARDGASRGDLGCGRRPACRRGRNRGGERDVGRGWVIRLGWVHLSVTIEEGMGKVDLSIKCR
ncbi:hypothetical protein PVAP13_6NG061450 [Panicum virgatum]|uniref:Uncharacterized protein n=1 Tax=Panicum virgatum TaxID=38727 RepID=A0A8T0QV90_PANVG|nr:hypothetical protein PVAP13_6NG061450 [Panicum virgatum]